MIDCFLRRHALPNSPNQLAKFERMLLKMFLGRGVGSAVGGIVYDTYGARTLFRGCAALSGCGIILLVMGRMTYRFICLSRDTHTHGVVENCSNDNDERKSLLDQTIPNDPTIS